eukprot:1141379-Pelagomonas_calceolata.AAC.1
MVGDKIMYIFLTFEETTDIHCDYLEVVVPLLCGLRGVTCLGACLRGFYLLRRCRKTGLLILSAAILDRGMGVCDLARMNERFINVDDISMCVGSGPR